MRISVVFVWLCAAGIASADGGRLFVGLEGSKPMARSTDLSGFPDVRYDDYFAFDVSGAAAKPDGTLFLCNGAFTTKLYVATLEQRPRQVATISVDIHSLAYGRDELWGFSNFATPKGIYKIDTNTGVATFVHDVYSNTGFRFFALDYNPVDDLLYGYTEYGISGLYSIDIDTGEMVKIAPPPPAQNGQGRGMAIGNNTVYLTATRGDDGIPSFAYDLSQGRNGKWAPFTNAHPNFHSTGGAAWIPGPICESINRLKARCKPARRDFTLKARIKSALPKGTVVTLLLDGQRALDVTVNNRGKAKARWKNVAEGNHEVCIEQCKDICRKANCR